MSGPRRPLPVAQHPATAYSESNGDQIQPSTHSFLETVDFAIDPTGASAATSPDDNQLLTPPSHQRLGPGGTPPMPPAQHQHRPQIRPQQPSRPEQLLLEDSLVYRSPSPEPLLSDGWRNLVTVGAAIVAAVFMVLLITVFALRLGATPAETTIQLSQPQGESTSTIARQVGPAPSWIKGNTGVLDHHEVTQDSSALPTGRFTANTAQQTQPKLQPKLQPSIVPLDVGQSNAPIDSTSPEEVESANQGRTVSSVFFASCDMARLAGAAPIEKGSPGFRKQLDADGDGLACETASTKTPMTSSTKLNGPLAALDADPAQRVLGNLISPLSDPTTTTTPSVTMRQISTTDPTARKEAATKPPTTRRTTTDRPSTTRTSTSRLPSTTRLATTERLPTTATTLSTTVETLITVVSIAQESTSSSAVSEPSSSSPSIAIENLVTTD